MKVLHICYNKGLGGVEQIYLRYNEAFLSYGWDVVSMLPAEALLIDELNVNNKQVVLEGSLSSSRARYNPLSILKLRRTLNRIAPDIIVVHNGRPLEILKKSAKGKYPIVVVHHGGNIKRFKFVSDVICITHYMQKELEAFFSKSLHYHYLPNIIDNEEVLVPKNGENDTLAIGFIGRLEKEKGAHILLEAVSKLAHKQKTSVWIAGDGAEREALELLAVEKGISANFLGWTKGEEKKNFFNKIDALVVPSYHEAFGIVILEGWAAGIPVIASKTKGGAELIEHNQNGLLFDIGDIEGLADTIETLDTRDCKTIVENALKTLEEFNTDSFRGRLKNICEEIVSRK